MTVFNLSTLGSHIPIYFFILFYFFFANENVECICYTVVSALAHAPREARKVGAIANHALKCIHVSYNKNRFGHCITACVNADCGLIWRVLMRTLLWSLKAKQVM